MSNFFTLVKRFISSPLMVLMAIRHIHLGLGVNKDLEVQLQPQDAQGSESELPTVPSWVPSTHFTWVVTTLALSSNLGLA